MKHLNLVALGLTLCFNTYAQKAPQLPPLIIHGHLANCPEKYLKIFFRDKHNQQVTDTLRLDKDGNFYLKTFAVSYPQKTDIQQNNIQVNDFFVAPGYDLTITGDARDFKTLFRTKRITGKGAESNRYRLLLDSIAVARNDHAAYYDFKEADLIAYIKKDRALKDSIANVAFNSPGQNAAGPKSGKRVSNRELANSLNPTDPYFDYFKKMVQTENSFSDLYKLMLSANLHNYNYDRSLSLITNNFDKSILKNILSPGYMSSDYYRDFMATEYLKFQVRLDKLKDTSLKKDNYYILKKVNSTYSGALKYYTLTRIIDNTVYQIKSLSMLADYSVVCQPFISTLTNPYDKAFITKQFAEKESLLQLTQTGKPAPNFSLKSNTGGTFNLADFKGKVVYIDLWASWCVPCREETPALKALYAKYKDDNRIAIISIAVSEGLGEWQRAIKEDKPTWLQLLDKDNFVSKNYAATLIPKFILIDKQGNIASFDAPRPSSKQKIEALLNAEMGK